MATESDPAVTKVTVVLDKPSDRSSWLFIRKDTCRHLELWQYVDPDTPKAQLPRLVAPVEPTPGQFKAGVTTFAGLDEKDREAYKWEYERYERRRHEYQKKSRALADFTVDISKTVSRNRLYIIENCETAHDRLVALKKHLAPNDSARKYEIAEKYNSLKVAPKAARKIEQWLQDWPRYTAMGKALSLPETSGYRPQEDFLIACKALDAEYAVSCLRDVYKADNEGNTAELPTLDDYVEELTKYLRRVRPHSTGLAVTAAELEVAKPAESKKSSEKSSKGRGKGTGNGSRPIPECICGATHWYSDCWYINEKNPNRPSNWMPNPATAKKVAEAQKDCKIQSRIERSLQEWAKRNPQHGGTSDAVQMDNGKPPSGETNFAMNLNPLNLDDTDIDVSFCATSLVDEEIECVPWSCIRNTSRPITIDDKKEPLDKLITMPLEGTRSSHIDELLTRWIVDPGSNTHVINSETWKGWTRTSENVEGRTISAGNSQILINAWGSMDLIARTPSGLRTLKLTHVAFVEGFLTSLIGLARCRTELIHFDSGEDILYRKNDSIKTIIANLDYIGGHWLIDADPLSRPPIQNFENRLTNFGVSYRSSVAPKPNNVVSQQVAHQIWGHPSKKAVEHLPKHVDGITLTDGAFQDCLCEVCVQTRLTRIISRRPPDSKSTRPFYRIAIDLIYLVKRGGQHECWNRDRYGFHAVCEYSKWHELETFPDKRKPTMVRWFKALIFRIQRVFNRDVIVVRSDGEAGFGNELKDICYELGIILEVTPPDTHEPNGLVERAGGTIILRARALRIQANLPKTLANEMFKSAVYILNRTPTEALEWKTPFETLWGRRPLVAHMRPIGCRAYAYNRKLTPADKTESRALIGHLVGYQGTNIFRIWLPTKENVFVTRDVIFDSMLFFNGLDGYADESIIAETVELLDYSEIPVDDEIDIEDLLTSRQQHRLCSSTRSEANEENRSKHESSSHQPQLFKPNPSDTRSSGSLNDLPASQSEDIDGDQAVPEGYRMYGQLAPKDINLNPNDPDNIVEGKRIRKQRDLNTFAAYTYAAKATADYIHSFSIHTMKPDVADEIPRIHQSQLPKPPRLVRELGTHMFGAHFTRALRKEWSSLREKGCFRKTEKTKATADAEVLPLMWIFNYKTGEDGFLLSFKARLVIRGDLEDPLENTYAATLAIRNFRAIIAIANYFDLELKQYDIPTAFLNAKLNRKLYAIIPDGVQDLEGVELLEVLLALYGLKESPLLWYQTLKATLEELGLRPVSGFPCLYTDKWVIFFVYVDDIVMAFHTDNKKLHDTLERKLVDIYDLKNMGDLRWFLGIRVVRDRTVQKTWLVQDAFIDKVCARFKIDLVGKIPEVPINENWLPQSTEESDQARTKLYQQLVGSLAYIAVWGRPDVARAHVIFACHLTNPGQAHVAKIRQTWRYLLGTRGYALQASASTRELSEYVTDDPLYKDPLFFGASDASYADEPETRRSSQGYLFKFGGMTIDWKSSVQRTVTKSTTEAELLSLSLSGSQVQEWLRFFDGISLDIDCKPTIWYDNQRTVGIATKAQDKLYTKVKHVDIHQLWIRQEIEAARLSVVWVPTNQMPADGLTKALPKQKFILFVKQLGLEDITERLKSFEVPPIEEPKISFSNPA